MRKGTVFIVVRNIEQRKNLCKYIVTELERITDTKIIYKSYNYEIIFNGYKIIITLDYRDNKRGYRPEIVYIDTESNISEDDMMDAIEPKIFLSTRKEPIRILNLDDFNSIDLKEFYDDDYTIKNTIDTEKNNRWNEIHNK